GLIGRVWVNPRATGGTEVLLRGDGSHVGEDRGVRFVAVIGAGPAGPPPMAPNSWHHIAVTAAGSAVTLYVDGQSTATVSASLPVSTATLSLGDTFAGELDELEISKAARPAGFIKIAAMNQGPD